MHDLGQSRGPYEVKIHLKIATEEIFAFAQWMSLDVPERLRMVGRVTTELQA